MAKVQWSNGIDFVSGALNKVDKKGQHSHEKMLLATHRTAPTESDSCTRIYLRKAVTRTTPIGPDEMEVRNRFKAVAQAVNARKKDLNYITTDQQNFLEQKDLPGGKRTMKAYLWKICGEAYDAQH